MIPVGRLKRCSCGQCNQKKRGHVQRNQEYLNVIDLGEVKDADNRFRLAYDLGVRPLELRVKKYPRNKYPIWASYGSFAKGEANEESDVDIAVVTAAKLNPDKVENSQNTYLFQILMEKSELVSVFVIPENEINLYKSPFILNTKEEGVPL